MSSLLLRMCILNYPVWTCPENSHEHHFAWWFLFCGRLEGRHFFFHSDHGTRFSYSPQFWLNYLWSVQLFGSLDSPVFLQLSIIVLVVILSYCHTVLAELLMISAIVWITRFPSFSSAIHNSFSRHTETGLTCACVNLPVFGDFFSSMSCVPDA